MAFTTKAQQQYPQAEERSSEPADNSSDVMRPEELESTEQS